MNCRLCGELADRCLELKVRIYELQGLCYMAHRGGRALEAVRERLDLAWQGRPIKKPKANHGDKAHLWGCPLREDWDLFDGQKPPCLCELAKAELKMRRK